MAVQRDRPYNQFNFLVDLGTGDTDGPDAGFQEISGIGMEVAIAEYRNGNDRENQVRKIPGLTKYANVTLKRGTMIKGIRLTGNTEEVDCRHEKVKGLVLRTEFLKKA